MMTEAEVERRQGKAGGGTLSGFAQTLLG